MSAKCRGSVRENCTATHCYFLPKIYTREKQPLAHAVTRNEAKPPSETEYLSNILESDGTSASRRNSNENIRVSETLHLFGEDMGDVEDLFRMVTSYCQMVIQLSAHVHWYFGLGTLTTREKILQKHFHCDILISESFFATSLTNEVDIPK